MITHVWGLAQGCRSHTDAVEIFGRSRCFLRPTIKSQDSRPNEASDFRLTAASSQLIFPHEFNSQGGSVGGGLVRPRSSQLRGHAPLASHGAIDNLGSMVSLWAVESKVRCHRTSLRWDGQAGLSGLVAPESVS